jgi:DNA polymerase-3 subunit beta
MLKQVEQTAIQPAQASLLQFVCDRARLERGLSLVNHAVSKSRSDIERMQLLGYIRMEVKDGFLILSATNLEISVTARVELTEKDKKNKIQEGVVAVPARLFTELIGAVANGEVSISVAQNYKLYLDHSRGDADIQCLSAEEYPPIPGSDDGELPALLPIAPLKEVTKEVGIAASKDISLPALTCLLLHVENDKVLFAATDRFRTAHRPLFLPSECKATYDILVPHRSLAELASILPNEGMVVMSVTPSKGQVIFHTQWMTFSSRLIEGTFPNYAAAIPKKEDRQARMVVNTAAFKEIMQIASIYANAGDSGVVYLSIKGSLGMEPGSLSVISERSEIGGGKNAITAAVEGEDQEEIPFDYKLLLEALSVTTTQDVILEIGVMRVKSGGAVVVTAPAGVLKSAGTNTCIHSFMSSITN